ncbi:DUF418 domain-containing protein [Lysobacter antibioticus]|uniref:DUF418 domain-containing protein n=1 Tax=Lysobacter antibioticus TaxID=84531 RepID=A0A0S2F5X0_LYSAN|nr:DUF418 domain-containing protein [Lysobacter antibioticus]ALN78927.1 hypothetical protein LA76x_0766 [Lysobacter antibioticus]
MTASAHAVPPRIEQLDALRGLALFGILVVNLGVFASPYYGLGLPDPSYDGGLDRAVRLLVAGLFEMKFYLLFSFLFGYSFSLQLDSAQRAGEAFVPRMLRRLLGLWLIGLAHALLLFHGDILSTYAAMGLVLLTMRALSERTALRSALILIVATAVAWAGLALLIRLSGEAGAVDARSAAAEAQATLAGFTGPPSAVIAQRVRELASTGIVLVFMQAPCALAMFLLGRVAGRRQMLAHLDRYPALLRRLRLWGFGIGLPAAALYAGVSTFEPGGALELSALTLSLLTAPLLTGAYAALAMSGFAGRAGQGAVRLLAPAGRMALSNYLLQSAAAALAFTGYGFGLMGRLSPLTVLAFAIMLFGAQLRLSAWWMQRHGHGPMEWLLRAITLGAWPRWRKPARDAA